MKPLYLTSIILALSALMTACGPGRGKALSEYEDATTGDSALYYYAQLRAHEYWKAAMSDTTLRNPEQRRQYLEGVKAGFDAVKMNTDYDTYNRGVRRGVQMAIRYLYFESTYGVELNKDILMEGLTYALMNPPEQHMEFEHQNNFYRLYDRMKAQSQVLKEKETRSSLSETARKMGLEQIQPDLYYKITQPGKGAYPHRGDVVSINVEYGLVDGTDIGLPSPPRLTVGGPGMPEIMELAYLHLNEGASGTFLTTASNVFGERSEIIGARPDELLVVKIHMNSIARDNAYPVDNEDMSAF